jgi:hypothetical protein
LSSHAFGFKGTKEAFHHSIVVAVAHPAQGKTSAQRR